MIPSAPLGTDAAAGRPQGLGAAAGAGLDEAAAERRFRFELAAHPGSPAQARRLTRARLTGWSVCEDTCDTAALVISELVTNAIVHTASGTVVCELHDGDDLVRIAVRDEGCAPGEPHPSPQRPEEEHGRGLFLVDALCHAWGAQEHGPGLLVWADLPRGGEGSHGRAEPHDDVTEPASYDDLVAPRDDLGWGARPKPGPAGGSGDEGDSAGHGEQEHRSPEAEGRTSGPVRRAQRAFVTDGPLARVAAQRRHSPATGGLTAGPVRSADHALDTDGEAPSWRPHPGTERDRDRDPA
ncbi:ATPase [Streptomyces aurantiogriseus]|uniref:ATPase n=1 Tax=Streptomyces aurantiogriseus TaxID=66870 RepID=A0A918FMY0_9ACTN|nr:ATPase [Streptomyces aurantiogriseus]